MPREGHDCRIKCVIHKLLISIHVPREGHDGAVTLDGLAGQVISIHVPREGHDVVSRRYYAAVCLLISIHVPREGHDVTCDCIPFRIAISIHVPREGHDLVADILHYTGDISIHVPREGHDQVTLPRPSRFLPFQSTCPARGTTAVTLDGLAGQVISIHVPREGHDLFRVKH